MFVYYFSTQPSESVPYDKETSFNASLLLDQMNDDHIDYLTRIISLIRFKARVTLHWRLYIVEVPRFSYRNYALHETSWLFVTFNLQHKQFCSILRSVNMISES